MHVYFDELSQSKHIMEPVSKWRNKILSVPQKLALGSFLSVYSYLLPREDNNPDFCHHILLFACFWYIYLKMSLDN